MIHCLTLAHIASMLPVTSMYVTQVLPTVGLPQCPPIQSHMPIPSPAGPSMGVVDYWGTGTELQHKLHILMLCCGTSSLRSTSSGSLKSHTDLMWPLLSNRMACAQCGNQGRSIATQLTRLVAVLPRACHICTDIWVRIRPTPLMCISSDMGRSRAAFNGSNISLFGIGLKCCIQPHKSLLDHCVYMYKFMLTKVALLLTYCL